METTHVSTDRAGIVEGGVALAGLIVVALLLLVTTLSAVSVILAL